MGYLLKEALKTLCGVNQWAYAVFWKIGCQNPKLLIWEECYYGPITYSGFPHISGIESPELAFDEWEDCWVSAGARTSWLGVQAGDRVHVLVNKMMMDNHVNVVGEGLVGRAAFTGNHQWVLSENYNRAAHPPEVLNEVCQQLSAGMQTVAVIPVLPHGVVQLGSSLSILENMGFVNDVKTLVLQLGCVPGALLSDNYATKEPAPKIGVPICLGKSVSADLSGRFKVTGSTPFIADSCSQKSNSSQASRHVDHTSFSQIRQIQDDMQSFGMARSSVKSNADHHQAKVIPVMKTNVCYRSQLENAVTGAEVIALNPEVWLNQEAFLYFPRSRYDQPPSGVPSAATYDSLRLMEQQILSDAIVGDHHANNSLSASNGSMISQQRTNGGLASSSQKDFVSAPSLELSELHNCVGGNLISNSNPLSLSDGHSFANNNGSCAHVAGSGLQNVDSSQIQASTSDFGDILTAKNHVLLGSFDDGHYSADEKYTIESAEGRERVENDLFQALSLPFPSPDEHMRLSGHIPDFLHDSEKHACGYQRSRLTNAKFEDSSVQPPSGDDLFDILGVDFKNKLFNGSWNNLLYNGPETNTQSLDKNKCVSIRLQDAGSDLYSVNDGNSDSGIFSVSGTDHLLDAVVSRVHSAAIQQSSDDNVSCRTTLTKISSSSAPIASPSSGANTCNQMQGELFGLPKSLIKAGALGSSSFRSGSCKEDSGNYSHTSSFYGSHLSSWVEQGHDMKRNSSVSTAYSKRPDEISKSNRKRLKPGENPRPRPKDRQMIQDRVKELREIVPNGAKCSIDALLERTIKHMLFLQSVTKHADKLKQMGESKIISKEGGLLLKDNFEGGATWAYEVGSQSMVCPIIVEDLCPPRQMLVEMLCEERGLFLEIADIIRGLGLTILKGVMETRNNKIWARFSVEANRDVTRMEIFVSLVRLLEQTVKCDAASANCNNNDNMIAHQSFHQAASIPATGRPCGLQ